MARLRQAIVGLEAVDMALYARAARHRLGALVGADKGRHLLATTDAWFQSEGVARPAAFLALLAPGFDG